jgi:hypothetical protein
VFAGETLNSQLKVLSQALGPLAISAVEKERFRKVLAAWYERVKKWKKDQTVRAACKKGLQGQSIPLRIRSRVFM